MSEMQIMYVGIVTMALKLITNAFHYMKMIISEKVGCFVKRLFYVSNLQIP